MTRFAVLSLTIAHAAAGDEQERNKILARKFYEEAWFKGNAAYAREVFAPRYTVFDPRGRPGVAESAEEQERIARRWCVVNGDCSKSEIHWQAAEGDRVVTYWTIRQQPKRFFLAGLARIFGRVPLERPILNVFRFENGRIVETTNQRDDLGIYADMGLINFLFVVIFALGGAGGLVLSRLVRRVARRPV